MSDTQKNRFGTWTYTSVAQDVDEDHAHVIGVPLEMHTRTPMYDMYGEVMLCTNTITEMKVIAAPPNGADPDSQACTAMLVAVTRDGHMHYLDYINDVPVFADLSMN